MEAGILMRYNNSKKVIGGAVVLSLAMTFSMPMTANELETEMASAGGAVIINDYIENIGDEADLEKLLPKEMAQPTPEESESQTTSKPKDNAEDKLFSDIAIASVSGGAEDYVNVRKKPSTDSKILGKIYNNCGARILEKTDNGWYKIVSGNCTGYIKAEFFEVGNGAKTYALDFGYVFANIKDTGIRVRKKPSTDAEIVQNVYHNENYVIKKFSSDGNWVKIKIGAGVSGWISSQYVDISIDMDTAITIKEEKEMIRKQKEEAERLAQEQAAAAQQQNQNTDSGNSDNSNDGGSNDNSAGNGGSSGGGTTSYGDNGSGGASSVVAYAKQFLGNPYVYGGSSLTNGTDCSGFTMSVYAHFGYGLSRASYTQVNNGTAVSMGSLQPGDLLFYKYGGATISHVAMYIGGGQIIHASTEETGIIISGMGSPCAARRIIN